MKISYKKESRMWWILQIIPPIIIIPLVILPLGNEIYFIVMMAFLISFFSIFHSVFNLIFRKESESTIEDTVRPGLTIIFVIVALCIKNFGSPIADRFILTFLYITEPIIAYIKYFLL